MRDWLFDNLIIWLFARQLDAYRREVIRRMAGIAIECADREQARIHDLRRLAFDAGRIC